MNKPKVSKSRAMTSTLRCLRVLELLAEEPFELGISELAGLLKSPASSAHRLCATLVHGGLVEHDSGTKRYRLAPKALWVGSGYLRHSAIYRAAFFAMQDVAKQVPGAVQLGVLDNGWILFIHSLGSPDSTDAFADVGLRRPLYATASGKLFLSDMPSTEVDRIMSAGVKQYTQRTIISSARMKEELREIGEKGYATNNEELLPGYFVVAAPVYDRDNDMVATISATIAKDRIADGNEAKFTQLVRQAAARTSLQLGHRPKGPAMM